MRCKLAALIGVHDPRWRSLASNGFFIQPPRPMYVHCDRNPPCEQNLARVPVQHRHQIHKTTSHSDGVTSIAHHPDRWPGIYLAAQQVRVYPVLWVPPGRAFGLRYSSLYTHACFISVATCLRPTMILARANRSRIMREPANGI